MTMPRPTMQDCCQKPHLAPLYDAKIGPSPTLPGCSVGEFLKSRSYFLKAWLSRRNVSRRHILLQTPHRVGETPKYAQTCTSRDKLGLAASVALT